MKQMQQGLFLILAFYLSGCGPVIKPPPPPSANQAYLSWNEYQSELANFFDGKIGRANNMRVVPATLIYPIGTVVRRDSMSQLTRKCSFKPEALPSPTPGPIVPTVTASKKIKFGVDPGSFISKGIKELDELKLDYDKRLRARGYCE